MTKEKSLPLVVCDYLYVDIARVRSLHPVCRLALSKETVNAPLRVIVHVPNHTTTVLALSGASRELRELRICLVGKGLELFHRRGPKVGVCKQH